MIPYARPDLDADDIQAVLATLQTEWLTNLAGQFSIGHCQSHFLVVWRLIFSFPKLLAN
jgi:hypothetical protein